MERSVNKKTGLNWHKLSEMTPHNNAEVLVRSKGILNLAFYSKASNVFFLKDGNTVDGDVNQITWTDKAEELLSSPKP